MLNTRAMADRLLAAVPALADVGEALDLSQVAKNAVVQNSAFVVLLSERGHDNRTFTDSALQQVDVLVAIILAVVHTEGQRTTSIPEDLPALRLGVRQSLLGYAPGDEFAPFTFTQGQLAGMEPGVVWWTDVFKTSYMTSNLAP